MMVVSSCDLCFHKFSPVRHSKAVTPWEHYKLQCIVRILLLYWFPPNQCHMLNTSRFFNSTRLNQLGLEPKQLIIRRDQHFTLQLNMRRTHILRLETRRMQTSIIHVVGSRHLWAVRKREKEIPSPILPVDQVQEEIKVKNNDKKITQSIIPSLALAFQVELNKETNSHCWQH
jgi:hypothetical protein